jgi:electron transfer flavoprotein beta subunit
MRIVVCLHAAGSSADALGPNDAWALQLARALAGQHHVIALLAGNREETAPLVAALAAGADRAVRVGGESFAASDFHTLGQVLASAIRTLGADLVLTGAHTDTEGLGALSASIARHMALPHLANIETLEAIAGAPAAMSLVVTVRGGGQKRRLGVPIPVVMSVANGPPADAKTRAAGLAAPAVAPVTATIETLALADPEVTVIRRRTEILGGSSAAAREGRTVASAAELMAALTKG